jgi:hypothetical protein
MDLTTKIFIAFVIFKIALDYFSVKRPSVWFDVIYIVMFFALGIWALNTANSLAGLLSLGVAIAWAGWVCVRKNGLLEKFKKPTKTQL